MHEIDLTRVRCSKPAASISCRCSKALALPGQIAASANPKSSTGRLDIFTRVMTDFGQEFDKIAPGYTGPLWLEVSPRTFPIVARTGSRLSQIRFPQGHAVLDEDELSALHRSETLVASETPNVSGGGIALSIDLMGQGEDGLIGYRGKHHTAVIDVDKRAAQDVFDFWEPLYNRGSPT
jgi:dCTP deaminase